jgi:hypothetical protein
MIGRVEFEAGGVARYMRLTTNAQVRFQQAAGRSLLAAFDAVRAQSGDLDFEAVRRMVWAVMSHENLTEDQAGDLMDDLGITRTFELLAKAVVAAYPEAAKAAEGNGRGAKKPQPKTLT